MTDDSAAQTEQTSASDAQQGGYYRSERSYGLFRRVVALPEGTDPDEVKGSFKEGVLEVTLPQAQHEQTRQIELR